MLLVLGQSINSVPNDSRSGASSGRLTSHGPTPTVQVQNPNRRWWHTWWRKATDL